jgi:hypothetical protein
MAVFFGGVSNAQTSTVPLPPNYTTILDTPDFLVMRVHYGPHEFVPMHDHTAFPTIYVYLNDSGEVEIIHEGDGPGTLVRPPTHTGAFRIAPGAKERHSVRNLGDAPSDFLRIELKRIPPVDLRRVFRGEAPPQPFVPGTKTEFKDAALQVDRIHCGVDRACLLPAIPQRSLLVALTPMSFFEPKAAKTPIQPGEVMLLPAGQTGQTLTSPGARCLRIVLFYPAP